MHMLCRSACKAHAPVTTRSPAAHAGIHVYNDMKWKFIRMVSQDMNLIEHGPVRFLTVRCVGGLLSATLHARLSARTLKTP
jgi:hypothetical protein